MQFNNIVALTIAAMASMVSAGDNSTVTVTSYACSSSTTTIASTGVVTSSTATGSPITYATNAASMNSISGLGMAIAGGVALFL